MDVESLEAASLEPACWWRLDLDDEQRIKIASQWKNFSQWIYSLFSDRHKNDLRHRVCTILETVPDLRTEQQKIAVEKVSRLIHSKYSWLYRADLQVKNPSQTRFNDAKEIKSSIQPHEEGGRYYNFQGEHIWSQFFSTIYLLFPGSFSKSSNEDLKTWNRTEWKPQARSVEPQLTWLGHATVLFQAENINLIFDPVFDFVGPCFHRYTAPPVSVEKLPLIDSVVISHNHADHCDPFTLTKLSAFLSTAFVPDRADEWFKERGFELVEGKKWWQSSYIERDGRRIKLTAMPAQHGSCTGVADYHRSLWMGIMVQVNGLNIYFAGDTGYNRNHLDEIKKHFKIIDIALLPIAPEKEPEMHLDHSQALDAFERLGAKQMIPIHHGAYRTGAEKIEDPLNLLMAAAQQRGLADKILALKLGETKRLVEKQESETIREKFWAMLS
jgi:N-acyl-phosphatidylethanolamine-hydrolysing phospholipase D